MSYLVVNFAKEDNDKYYLINVLIFLAKVFLHKLSFKVLSHFPVFLKSYLDSLLIQQVQSPQNGLIVSFK